MRDSFKYRWGKKENDPIGANIVRIKKGQQFGVRDIKGNNLSPYQRI